MAKVLPLEGPHEFHHPHGKDASVPGKDHIMAVPSGHWEKHYDLGPAGKATPGGAFLPKRSADRPQPYNKLNREDH